MDEARLFDDLKSDYTSKTLELKVCLRRNKDNSARCEDEEGKVAEALSVANAQALVVGEEPITPKPADNNNIDPGASSAKGGGDHTVAIAIAVVVVVCVLLVAVIMVKKTAGGKKSNAMSHINPVYEMGNGQQQRNAGMAALPQAGYADPIEFSEVGPAGNAGGYADVVPGFNSGYADVGEAGVNTGGYDVAESDEEEC